jgi:hypothetical protein
LYVVQCNVLKNETKIQQANCDNIYPNPNLRYAKHAQEGEPRRTQHLKFGVGGGEG